MEEIITKKRKKDKRIDRTKNAIQNAFISLLAEKSYNDITVKDIADRADVDRRTIYNYYKGIHEIREEMDRNIIGIIRGIFAKIDIANHLNDPDFVGTVLGEEIEKNFELIDKIMKIEMDSNIISKIEDSFAQMIADLFEAGGIISKEMKGVIGNFAAAGLLYSYQKWFKSNRLVSIRVETKYIVNMIAASIKSLREFHL